MRQRLSNFRSEVPLDNRFPFLRSTFILLFIFCAFTGCSTYQNVTAYFNTYYNAKQLFRDGEAEIRQAPQKDRDTSLFAAYNVPQSAQTKFDKVVEKCSKLIQFYPSTSWVDDAILMIAKSDFYLGDYESSLRKCKELQDNFSTSGLRFEARLVEAKDYYLMKKDDDALKAVKELIPELRTEGKNDLLLEGLMLQAQIYNDRREYDQAAQSYALALQLSGDAATRAFGAYQLGECYEKLGNSEQAAEAYADVQHYSPGFELEYRARLKHGSMLRESGKHDQALHTLDELNDEPLRPEQHGLVDLEIANTYRAMGDTTVAFSFYNLIDTVYRHSEASGKSLYIRGRYYEETMHDYKTAREYYVKAKGEAQAGEVARTAERKANSLDRYFALLDNIKRYDLFLHPDTSHGKISPGDSLHVEQSIPGRIDSSKSEEDTPAIAEGQQDSQPPNDDNPVVRPAREERSEEGSAAFRRRHADRDLEADDEPADGSQPENNPGEPKSDRLAFTGDSTHRTTRPAPVVKAQNLSPDSVRSLTTQSYYELGTLFYLELERPDSAQRWYQRVVDEFPLSRFVPRTLYAQAELHRSMGDSVGVDSLYALILDRYGSTEYAAQIRRVRGLEVKEQNVDTIESSFLIGEELLQKGETQKALKEFKKIAKAEKRSELTSKAEYAVGWIYESILFENDSAASWYKRVMKEDSTSVYALAAAPKVRIKEKPESLKDFVKIKEIEQMSKTPKIPSRRRVRDDATTEPNEGDDEVGRPGRTQQLNDDDTEPTDDEEEDVPDPDDDGNNNN